MADLFVLCKPGARIGTVLRDALLQGRQTVVLALVMQFVQQFHAHDSTVAPIGSQRTRPVQAVRFQQHTAAVHITGIQRWANAHIGHTRQRAAVSNNAMHLHAKNAAGGRLPVGKAQVERGRLQATPEFASVHHMTTDRIRVAQQRGYRLHVPTLQGLAHRGTAHAQALHCLLLHAAHFKPMRPRHGLQQRQIARPLCTKTEIVTHQHIAGAQSIKQNLLHKLLGRQGGQPRLKRQDHGAIDSQRSQGVHLVAQGGDARRSQIGLASHACKIIARMRLERDHAHRQSASMRLAPELGQHGLVAAVNAVEIADGERTTGNRRWLMQATLDFHGALLSALMSIFVERTPLSPSTLAARIFRAVGWFWVLASLPLAWLDMQGRWLAPGRDWASLIKLWIYWGSWAALPLVLDMAIRLWQKPRYALGWPWAGLLLLVAYSGLIEPRQLQIRTHHIRVQQTPNAAPLQTLRIALVSDIHAGLFVRKWQMVRLIEAINAQDVDAVVVAGDWLYEPKSDLLAELEPLARLRHPVFGVLGNHDTQAPGHDLEAPLRQTLQQLGVRLLEGKRQTFKDWELVGLSDLWSGHPRQEIAQLLQKPATLPRLVLMHQPDTAALLPTNSASFMVSGHTHGGQIWLPWITQTKVLPGMSQHGWYEGLYLTRAGALFVTAGAGTIGLPARLGVVPRVDVLHLAP